MAATADGKIDTRERRGAAISSDTDRQRVDALRASVDAVMVGDHTLHQEDPRLTVKSDALRAERVARAQPENPAKVAVVSRFRLPSTARFLTTGPARRIVFVPEGEAGLPTSPAHEVEFHACGTPRVDLVQAMQRLEALGIHRVLVEGGGTLNFELLRLGLVDEVQIFVAPLVFGGSSAPTLADGDGLPRDAAIRLRPPTVQAVADGGVLLRYLVAPT